MSKARDLANAGTALGAVTATELAFVDGVTSAIQTQLDAKTAKSTLTTTGDIYYASAANTPARLGIGSTDQVLKVTAGIPAWATASSGGMTLINTGGTTLTGASVTISSIPATYKNLQLIVRNYKPTTDGGRLICRVANDSAERYKRYGQSETGQYFDDDSIEIFSAGDNSAGQGLSRVDFFDYTNTTTWKTGETLAFTNNQTTTTLLNLAYVAWAYNQTGAISSLTFLSSTGDMTSGTAYLYGVS
jgi:hypothetical protein